jgi:hypothetical protein
MRIACIMMQKNEINLVGPWIRYHTALVGAENLYVFDNGSTEPSVQRCLQEAQAMGVHVDWRYGRQADFFRKGDIFSALIRDLDGHGQHDFYFPLDCDEFLATHVDDGVSMAMVDLQRALEPHQCSQSVLRISHKYWNNPCRIHHYALNTTSKKCFFARNACVSMDEGFHHGRSRLGEAHEMTDIVYIEFHYRPFRSNQIASRQKLVGLVSDFSRSSLRAYSRKCGPGFHCANELLLSEYDYLRRFLQADESVVAPHILATFEGLGIATEPLRHPLPPLPHGVWLFLLRLRKGLAELADSLFDLGRHLARWPLRLLRRMRRSLDPG